MDQFKPTGGELLMIYHMQSLPATETKTVEAVAQYIDYFNKNKVQFKAKIFSKSDNLEN